MGWPWHGRGLRLGWLTKVPQLCIGLFLTHAGAQAECRQLCYSCKVSHLQTEARAFGAVHLCSRFVKIHGSVEHFLMFVAAVAVVVFAGLCPVCCPVQCLVLAAKDDAQRKEQLVLINTRLLALCTAHDSVAADTEKLEAAAEVYRDLLSSVSGELGWWWGEREGRAHQQQQGWGGVVAGSRCAQALPLQPAAHSTQVKLEHWKE